MRSEVDSLFPRDLGGQREDLFMTRNRYTGEYKHHLLEFVREGRTPEQLAREYEPSARTALYSGGELFVRSW